MTMMGAGEAAVRLGVKVETVYAYVSRGTLTSHRTPDGRRSAFDPAEVEALARRGRPRRTTRPPALDFSIATSLTRIEGHRITYRGHDLLQLSRTASFEQVAELLWTGDLPPSRPRWDPLTEDLDPPGASGELTDHLRLAVVRAAAADPLRGDLRPEAVAATARTLLATVVQGLAPGAGAARSRRRSAAGELWTRLVDRRASSQGIRALDVALVLLADHELATSTLAARVAASARADPYSVVLAGLGPLAGPLHGGASRAVRRLLVHAEQAGPTAAIADALRVHGRLPGFGHPLYPLGDPRAPRLLELTDAVGTARDRSTVARVLAAARARADTEPNIDFALGVLGHLTSMPEEAGEAIFAISRAAGWIAHALEEYSEAPLRFRARAVPHVHGEAVSG